MALDRRMSNAAVNAEADALALLANSGYIRLYTGVRAATAYCGLCGWKLSAGNLGEFEHPAAVYLKEN